MLPLTDLSTAAGTSSLRDVQTSPMLARVECLKSMASADPFLPIGTRPTDVLSGHASLPVPTILRDGAPTRRSHATHFLNYTGVEKCIDKLGGMICKLSSTAAQPGAAKNREIASIVQDEKRAGKLEKVIKRWQKLLPLQLQQQIKPESWQNYETQFPSARTFSVFLSKLYGGFAHELKMPSFSWSKGFYCRKKEVFAVERLLPVLVAMQNNPTLTNRLFCIAEDGLGGCHNRPALSFVDIELEVMCETELTTLNGLVNDNIRSESQLDKACRRLIAIEHQKYRKAAVISSLIPRLKEMIGGNGDPMQNVVFAYKHIAKSEKFFPEIPFATCGTIISDKDMRTLCREAVSHVHFMESVCGGCDLATHLRVSDSWLKVLVMRLPEVGRKLEKIERMRTTYSEKLLDLPQKAFEKHYARDIQALEAAYQRARFEIIRGPRVEDFTERLVYCYLSDPAVGWP